jgi:hypothetical protein
MLCVTDIEKQGTSMHVLQGLILAGLHYFDLSGTKLDDPNVC